MVKQMDERQSENLSAVSDGEAVYDDVMSRLVATNTDFQKQWNHAHLVRDVMRGHKVTRDAMTLSQRVSMALESEVTVLSPKKRFGSSDTIKQAGGFAIAATIAVVAVLTVQQRGLLPQSETTNIASIPSTITRPVSRDIQNVATKQKLPRVSVAVERKLNSYIVNHNEYSATSKMQGMLPYVRIVGYVPTRRVANEK